MNCPHCKTELTLHEGTGGAKEGAQHCSGCGCCFLPDGKTPRQGVPVCALAPQIEEEPTKPINRMNKDELLAAIAESGLKVEDSDYTVPQLRALLTGVPAQALVDANEPAEPEPDAVKPTEEPSSKRSGD